MRLCAPAPCSRETRYRSSPPAPRCPGLTQRWRRQVGCRLRLAEQRGPRPLALVTYQIRGGDTSSLVPLKQLRFFSLFDERTDDDRLATRLLGFRPQLMRTGVQIGGFQGSLIDKDLRLPPVRGGGGRRLDASETGLVEAAFGLERHLERCARHPHYPRRATLRFPNWWCAVQQYRGDLPSRDHRGVRLVELTTALEHGLAVTAVFADLQHVSKRQVVACHDPARILSGTTGLTTFDLYHSRFRGTPDAFSS